MRKYTAYLGLASTLIFASLLDLGVNYLRQAAIRSFVLRPYLWGSVVANLLLAAAILGLFRLVMLRNKISSLTGIIFIIVGAMALFSPAIARTFSLASLTPSESAWLNFSSHFSIASAFILMMGILGVLADKIKS